MADTAGEIYLESLMRTKQFTVKADEDIERGELVCDDGSGNGLVAATAALAVQQKCYVALEAHDYSAESYHKIMVIEVGYVVVQKATGTAIKEGNKLVVSSTAGEITVFTKGDAPTGGVSTYYTTTIETNIQAAIDDNAGVIATAQEDAASATTTIRILLGAQ